MGVVVNLPRPYRTAVDARRKLTDEQLTEGLRLRAEGWSLRALAARYSLSVSAVAARLRAELDPAGHSVLEERRKAKQRAKLATNADHAEQLRQQRSLVKKKPEWQARNREYMRARRDARQELLIRAKDRPCEDCKRTWPHYVMQFDHRDPAAKAFNIGERYVNVSEHVLLDEIAKCDVVCANCHMTRTFFARKEDVSGFYGPRKG